MTRFRVANLKKVLIAYQISVSQHNALSLASHFSMPKSSVLKVIHSVGDLGIVIQFKGRRSDGYYELVDWGWINPHFLARNYDVLLSELRDAETE